MSRKTWTYLLVLAGLAGTTDARGDNIEGADRVLCTSVRTTECFANGICIEGEPEQWNVPRFVQVDLEKQIMSTTKASGEDRSTPIEILKREEDRVLIQGTDLGRAFSVVLNPITGLASTGIALDGNVVAVFSYCTPIDKTE